ncbi:MAG: hypothetical protein IKB34_02560, partial [Clostridia bacterium]|nr:hypothetical protein [Clostridia bacterium]
MNSASQRIIDLIAASPTPYHAAEKTAEILFENGFKKLDPNSESAVNTPKFFITRAQLTENYGTALIAVSLPTDDMGATVMPKGMRVCATHTDSPCFRLKPNPIMESAAYCRLNTERYGGGIWSSWVDRPLAVAGRVLIERDGGISSKNVVIPGNIVIPNVSI